MSDELIHFKMCRHSIVRYEKARQAVRDLTAERKALIGECESLDTAPAGPGDYAPMIEVGTLCLNTVFNTLMDLQEMNPGEMISYSETLEEMHAGGDCCDACHKSFVIKHSSLAEAKAEFGEAKRSLSRVGKQIMERDDDR